MRGVEGEQFAARFGNPAQFVVLELGRARPLVGTVGQVAGAVVAVAGKGMRIGKGRLKVISDDLIRLLGLDPTYSH